MNPGEQILSNLVVVLKGYPLSSKWKLPRINWYCSLVIGKGDKQREVYFSIRAMCHLGKYLKERKDDCEAMMITERKPYRRLSERGIQREIGVIASRAGLKEKVCPHVLRHTFAML